MQLNLKQYNIRPYLIHLDLLNFWKTPCKIAQVTDISPALCNVGTNKSSDIVIAANYIFQYEGSYKASNPKVRQPKDIAKVQRFPACPNLMSDFKTRMEILWN